MENEREKEILIDIEVQTSIEKKKGNNNNNQQKKSLNKTTSGVLNYNVAKDGASSSSNNAKHSRENNNVEVMIDKITRISSGGSEEECALLMNNNIHGKEKKKVKNSKKPSKPPRPPKGPSLTASDTKLVREIYDLNLKKRATTKRIRALSKSRAEKSSSSGLSTNALIAMIVTMIFIVVIIQQGCFSRGIPLITIDGSPQPSLEASSEGLISVKFPMKSVVLNQKPYVSPQPSLEPEKFISVNFPKLPPMESVALIN